MTLRVVAGALALAALSAPAFAAESSADMPTKAEFAARWSGLYVGGQIGALWSDETRDTIEPLTEVFSHSGSGWLGGAHVGYDYQFAPSLLIGVEGAFSGTSLSKNSPSVVFPPSGYETDVDWLATLTGRLGYVSGSWLVYARGGYAATSVNFIGTTPGDSVSVGGTRNGWTLGGGVEYMLNRNFSVGVEYNHYDFGTKHYLSQTVGGHPLDADVAFRLDSAMLRASFRFGD
jgi:outer membrane immunogenic protein